MANWDKLENFVIYGKKAKMQKILEKWKIGKKRKIEKNSANL